MHRVTAKQAQRECEWKRGKGVSSWIVVALVITLILTREAFSWKPFGCTGNHISQRIHQCHETFFGLVCAGDTQKVSDLHRQFLCAHEEALLQWTHCRKDIPKRRWG